MLRQIAQKIKNICTRPKNIFMLKHRKYAFIIITIIIIICSNHADSNIIVYLIIVTATTRLLLLYIRCGRIISSFSAILYDGVHDNIGRYLYCISWLVRTEFRGEGELLVVIINQKNTSHEKLILPIILSGGC